MIQGDHRTRQNRFQLTVIAEDFVFWGFGKFHSQGLEILHQRRLLETIVFSSGIQIELGGLPFSAMVADTQTTGTSVQHPADFGGCGLKDAVEFKRISYCRCDTINCDFSLALGLQELGKLGCDAQRELQRSGFGHRLAHRLRE